MEAAKHSRGLESFLAYLRDMEEGFRMAQADRAEAEAASQDWPSSLRIAAPCERSLHWIRPWRPI